MKIYILGTEYAVLRQNAEENPKMANCDGIHEPYSKKIIIDTDIDRKDTMVVENVDEYHHKVLRHEAFHAIFAEAGLDTYWNDEVLVEALARLYPKIKVIMEQLDGTDIESIGGGDCEKCKQGEQNSEEVNTTEKKLSLLSRPTGYTMRRLLNLSR